MALTRRTFIKRSSLAAVAAAVDPLPAATGQEAERFPGAPEQVPIVCAMCRAGCLMRGVVADGRLLRVEGNPADPGTGGRLCARGMAAVALHHDTDRLKYPLKRTGERGEGKWRRVSWGEAVDAVAAAIEGAVKRHGPAALALLHGGRVGAQMDFPHRLRLTLGYSTFTLADRDYRIPPPNLPSLPKDARISVQIPGITRLPGSRWYVHTELYLRNSVSDSALHQRDPWRAYFDADVVGRHPFFRTRRPGDTFRPFGLRGHRQRLSDFMIDHKIPADYRDAIPLLVSEAGQICWVCGWRTDHHSRVTANTRQVLSVRFKQKV